jgi:predicted nucleic acid-binding protein
MSFIVIYDACVLYPAPLRDLLIRLAQAGVVRARWTEQILDEVFRNVAMNRPDLQPARLSNTRELMKRAIPDCMVTGHERLIAGLELPDRDDRHVLAAAIVAGAQTIVTANLKDFPDRLLKPHGVQALSPDEFVLDLIDLAPAAVIQSVSEQARALKNPPQTLSGLLDTLRRNGLIRAVAKLQELGAGTY